jgi:putative oxidoreductase
MGTTTAPGRTASAISDRSGISNRTRYLAPAGRVLYSLIFLAAGPAHFQPAVIGYAAAQGVPLASVVVPLSGIIALVGGLSIALGYKARWGAWLLVLFLVPVTLAMHRFWGLSDPQIAQLQQAMFLKNVGLLGAALLVANVGSGPLSLKS